MTNATDTLVFTRAEQRAWLEVSAPHRPRAPSGQSRAQWFAMGDPQCSLRRFIEVLACHGLLAEDGSLRSDVGLVSLGDHFDFLAPGDDPELPRREGGAILSWLASHPPDQVLLLLGNHDLARVQEFAAVDDGDFQRAQAVATGLPDWRAVDHDAAKTAFLDAFPWAVTPGLISRDYSSFTVRQRGLVRELLLAQRFALSTTAEIHLGIPVLVTHASVTHRELGLLEAPDTRDPGVIASRLNDELLAATARVRASWQDSGAPSTPLDLRPLHVHGERGEEGGGLVYHRASTEPREAWSSNARFPRRYDPRVALPAGLAQLIGHVGHHRQAQKELRDLVTERARIHKHGRLRTLQMRATGGVYDLGLLPHEPAVATVYLADSELSRAELADCHLVPLVGVRIPPHTLEVT